MHGRLEKKLKDQEQVKSSPSRRQTSRVAKQSQTTNNTNTSESWGTHDSGLARDLDDREMDDTPFFGSPQFNLAALSALNNDIIEMRARLQKSELEKEALKCQLKQALEESVRSQHRLEAIGAAHESRITEMHCVIVELNKKLKAQQESAIMEEPEGSVSDLSFQEGSVYNSDVDLSRHDQHLNEDAENYEQRQEQDEYQETEGEEMEDPPQVIAAASNKSTSPCSLPPPAVSTHMQAALQEEILHLRAQVALLQSQLAAASHDDKLVLNTQGRDDNNVDDTNVDEDVELDDYTSDDLCETADIFDVEQKQESNDLFKVPKSAHKTGASSSPVMVTSAYNNLSNENRVPVSKLAERVRLRRTTEEKHITGTDLSKGGGNVSTEMAEHLVADLLLADHIVSPDIIASARLQNEVQRLQKKIEHLKVQNTVTSLTLAESREHCDQLYLLCGKYESNAVALQQALNCTDRAIEAYDVMLALLESKLSILENQPQAEESRRAAETVARHLLNRLSSENSMQENSTGPWQEVVVIDTAESLRPWTPDDDLHLRKHVSKLKGQRFTTQNTVVTLEPPFSMARKEELPSPMGSTRGRSRNENRRMDLETAVLMQELMGMREDVSEYKYRAENAEREKSVTQKRLISLQDALMQLQAQLADSEALLAMATKDRSSFSEAEYAANIERELFDALAREARLKARLQGLAGTLEAATRNTGEKNSQTLANIAELRQTNMKLDQSMERCEKKYHARMLKLEQKLQSISLNVSNNNVNGSSKEDNSAIKSVSAVAGTTIDEVPLPETSL